MPLVPHFTEMAFNGHTNPAERSEQVIGKLCRNFSLKNYIIFVMITLCNKYTDSDKFHVLLHFVHFSLFSHQLVVQSFTRRVSNLFPYFIHFGKAAS